MKTNILATISLLTSLLLPLPLLAQSNDELVQRLLTTKECTGCNLSGLNLNGLDLGDVNLSGADLTDASLKNTILVGANLRGAILRGANLTQAMLTGADISGADFTYADLTDANLFRAKANELGGTDFTNAIFSQTLMPNGNIRTSKQTEVSPPENPPQLPATVP